MIPLTNKLPFQKELVQLINKTSMENGSNTPDFILAEYLTDCLYLFERAVNAREKWFGREPEPLLPQPPAPTNAVDVEAIRKSRPVVWAGDLMAGNKEWAESMQVGDIIDVYEIKVNPEGSDPRLERVHNFVEITGFVDKSLGRLKIKWLSSSPTYAEYCKGKQQPEWMNTETTTTTTTQPHE